MTNRTRGNANTAPRQFVAPVFMGAWSIRRIHVLATEKATGDFDFTIIRRRRGLPRGVVPVGLRPAIAPTFGNQTLARGIDQRRETEITKSPVWSSFITEAAAQGVLLVVGRAEEGKSVGIQPKDPEHATLTAKTRGDGPETSITLRAERLAAAVFNIAAVATPKGQQVQPALPPHPHIPELH